MSLSPLEFSGWREHFQRYPVDGVERLLSMLISMMASKPVPDWKIRPWAYSARQIEEFEEQESESKESESMTPATKTILNSMFREVTNG